MIKSLLLLLFPGFAVVAAQKMNSADTPRRLRSDNTRDNAHRTKSDNLRRELTSTGGEDLVDVDSQQMCMSMSMGNIVFPEVEKLLMVDVTSDTKELMTRGQLLDFEFSHLAPAAGDVEIVTFTRGDIGNANEYYVVTAEGDAGGSSSLNVGNAGGAVGTGLTHGNECNPNFLVETFTIPEHDFNHLISGYGLGTLTIKAAPTDVGSDVAGGDCDQVDPLGVVCSSVPSDVKVQLKYTKDYFWWYKHHHD